MEKLGRIAIIGGGSWATAIAKMVLEKEVQIDWYMHRQDRIDAFINKGHNPAYLTNVSFDTTKIRFSSNINQCVENADTIIFATPSPYLVDELSKLNTSLSNKTIVTAIKGIIPEGNLLISDFFNQKYNIAEDDIIAIAGPCHAEEVAKGNLSYLTVSSTSAERAESVAALLRNDYIRVTTNKDIDGVEYSSVLKNVYAIASGIYNGLEYGDNFQSVFFSNAIQEIERFLNTAFKMNRNVCESVYLGDLLVTGYSKYSRNRTFGFAVGTGYSIKEAQDKMGMIAEGYFATKCIYEINLKYKVSMPILEAVYAVLYNGKNAKETMLELTTKLK